VSKKDIEAASATAERSSDLSAVEFRALVEKYGGEYIEPQEGVTHVVFIEAESSAGRDEPALGACSVTSTQSRQRLRAPLIETT
jgi:hypothetical protein